MKLMMVKIIFEVLLVPNKRVFRIQVNYVISNEKFQFQSQSEWENLKCLLLTLSFFTSFRALPLTLHFVSLHSGHSLYVPTQLMTYHFAFTN